MLHLKKAITQFEAAILTYQKVAPYKECNYTQKSYHVTFCCKIDGVTTLVNNFCRTQEGPAYTWLFNFHTFASLFVRFFVRLFIRSFVRLFVCS